ncbi:MAG: tRNA lysidine(34) synthetase TilS [Alistipes sp.]|nr:tRNA lysidine(34) synthetase TilS [Alistipes sp.]
MQTEALLKAFERYVERHELFLHEDKILLTVSGGVDSMVMLSIFVRLGYNVGVAHCNFGLRGEESDGDTEMVLQECEKLGIVCHSKRFDTEAEMARTGDSMEMAARRLRYGWFNELCHTEGYAVIAVAHHANDSIETFFINLLRGTGLRGLTGINRQYGRVVRPLLYATRKDILEYAVQNKIPYREDSSNRSTKYLRNKIRLGLLPLLREINPKFTPLMRGNLYRLNNAQLFIDAAIDRIRQEAVRSENGIDTIEVAAIDKIYPLEFVIYEILNSTYGFKGDVVEELCGALKRGVTDRRFYSRDYVAYLDRGDIMVARIEEEDDCEVVVEMDDMRSYCGNSVLYYEHTDIDNVNEYQLPNDVALIDESKLQYPLRLRRWREGDSFIPFGMAGRKKVGDFLTDCKVPIVERKRQFVLVSGEDIVWIVGRRTDDRFRVGANTENVLRITKYTI